MKTIFFFCSLLLLTSAGAQDTLLLVTANKTTSLLFSSPVHYVDRGHPEILVQQLKEAPNLLLVKAATPHLPESNLTVVTSDGRLHAFTVRYDSLRAPMIYRQGTQVLLNGTVQQAALDTWATMILDNGRQRGSLRQVRWGMEVQVRGFYSTGEVLLCHLVLSNRSPIDYDVDYLKLYIRDGKRARRAAAQEREIVPLHIYGNDRQIKGGARSSLVLALPKLTIPESQYLALEMGEAHGGRHLSLKLRNHHLLKASPLPGLPHESLLKIKNHE